MVKWRTITALGNTIASPRAKKINTVEPLLNTLMDTIYSNLYTNPPPELVKDFTPNELDKLRKPKRPR